MRIAIIGEREHSSLKYVPVRKSNFDCKMGCGYYGNRGKRYPMNHSWEDGVWMWYFWEIPLKFSEISRKIPDTSPSTHT